MSDIDSNDFGFILDFEVILESVLVHLCHLVADTRFFKTVLSCKRELNFEGSELCICMFCVVITGSVEGCW